MSVELLAIPLEFLLGMAIGFFLSDREEGLSFDEIKLSSMVFLVTNALIFTYYPSRNPMIFAHLTLTWVIMNLGTVAGEMMRVRIIQRLVDAGGTRLDAHQSVTAFIQATNRYAYQSDLAARDLAVTDLAQAEERLERLAHHNLRLSDAGDSQERVLRIKLLCGYYLEIADAIHAREDADQKAKLLNQLNEKGDAIADLAWHTLTTAERAARRNLRKTYATKLVQMFIPKGL